MAYRASGLLTWRTNARPRRRSRARSPRLSPSSSVSPWQCSRSSRLCLLVAANDARDDASAVAATTGHSAHTPESDVSLPLQSFAGSGARKRRGAGDGARRYGCGAAGGARRRPREGAHDSQGHDRGDRARREVQHLGVRRPRGARPGRPRARGPDRRDDLDERRFDPALDRLPRRPHRAQRRLQGRRAGRLDHVQVQGRRSRRIHVPLRHEARARAHRERHVRGDHRPAQGRPAGGRQRVRARRQRVVHDRRRNRRAGLARHGEGARADGRLGDVQRLREPVRHAPAHRRPGRDDAVLGRRCRARRTT